MLSQTFSCTAYLLLAAAGDRAFLSRFGKIKDCLRRIQTLWSILKTLPIRRFFRYPSSISRRNTQSIPAGNFLAWRKNRFGSYAFLVIDHRF